MSREAVFSLVPSSGTALSPPSPLGSVPADHQCLKNCSPTLLPKRLGLSESFNTTLF